MIRPVLTEILLFATPFAIYALFLWATSAGVLHPESWPLRVVIPLTVCALALVLGGFFFLAQVIGEPAGSNYVPPHMEDGKLVPGQFK
jgi:hypothetical protein